MTNIQTEAYNLRKPNKAWARKLLEQLYEQSPDDAYAMLYKYFEVTPPKNPKTLQEWVNKARSSEAFRPQLHHSYYDGEYLIATNGHRLHRVKCDLPQVGYYHADGSYMYIDFKFPETSRVFPSHTHSFQFDMNKHCRKHDEQLYRLTIFDGVKWYVNRKYLDDLMWKDKTAQIFTSYNDSKSPIHFVFDDRDAILMPYINANASGNSF